MIRKTEKKQVSFYCPKDSIERFQKLYPHCLTLFLSRSVQLALSDRALFEKIFFNCEVF